MRVVFPSIPRRVVRRIQDAEEIIALSLANRRLLAEPLHWGRANIGVGVLQALRSHRRISFAEAGPPQTSIDMQSTHIVVCEDGDAHAQVIAPHSVDSADAQTALVRLTNIGVVSKGLRGLVATVHQASKTITLYPYDLLLIATHCTDAPGYRGRYEFIDTDGRARSLVVDVTAGAEIERPDANEVHVTEFDSFVSLDGVDWADREGKAALPVGSAMTTYLALRRGKDIEPVRREPVERVRASMALRMADGNYLALPYALASNGSPIVINNACGSWHRLPQTFVASNARCYIGTLF